MSTTQIKKINCECPPNAKNNKNAIFITIETCCRKPCDSKASDNKIEDKKEQEKQEAPKSKRLFKLPVLPERFHGNGCAMEICVLERHQDNCMYKKDDAEGRTVDDRVGSYECIGRMVVRTCGVGPEELNGNQVGTGNFSGVVGSQKTNNKYADDDNASFASAISEDAMERRTANQEHAAPRGRGDTESDRTTGEFTSIEYNESVRRMNAPPSSMAESPSQLQKSYYNTVTSARTHQSSKAYDDTSKSSKAYEGGSKSSKVYEGGSKFSKVYEGGSKSSKVYEGGSKSGKAEEMSRSGQPAEEMSKSGRTAEAGSRSSRPVESFSKSSKAKSESQRVEQVMLATANSHVPNSAFIDGIVVNVENGRRHYPGDDCTLHFPRNPFFLQNNQIDQMYASRKVFPTVVDETNQTEVMHEFPRHKISLETITSLTDLSHRTERKKSGFWGSLFKKNSPPPRSKKRRRSYQQ